MDDRMTRLSDDQMIRKIPVIRSSGHPEALQRLWHRGTELLGCEVAIMGGAMSWVSERHLVAALSNAGAFGVIAASSMPPELLDKEIKATRELLRPRQIPSPLAEEGQGGGGCR